MADIKKALVLKKYTNPTIKVLVEYYKTPRCIFIKEADMLLEYQLYNYKIVLKEGKQAGFGPLYRIS